MFRSNIWKLNTMCAMTTAAQLINCARPCCAKIRKMRNVRNRYSCAPEQLRTSVLRREILKMRNMHNHYGCATEQQCTAWSLLHKTIQKNAYIPASPCPMSPLTDRFLKYGGDETILEVSRLGQPLQPISVWSTGHCHMNCLSKINNIRDGNV